MRQLERPKLILANLEINRAVRNQKELINHRLQLGKGFEDWTKLDYWNRHDVRGALMGYQGLVCAYCESSVELNLAETPGIGPVNGGGF